MAKMRIRKGDKVRVIAGKDRGKEGVVLRALPSEQRVVVEGVALAKKAVRPTPGNNRGGITTQEMPIHVSNVAFIDPVSGQPTKIGRKRDKDGKVIRVAKKSGTEL